MIEADWAAILAEDRDALPAYCDWLLDHAGEEAAASVRALPDLVAAINWAVANNPTAFELKLTRPGYPWRDEPRPTGYWQMTRRGPLYDETSTGSMHTSVNALVNSLYSMESGPEGAWFLKVTRFAPRTAWSTDAMRWVVLDILQERGRP